jgi:simple sugar transport system permease protein
MFAKSRNVSLKAKPDTRPRLKIASLKIDNTTLGLSLLLLVVIIGFSLAMPGRFFSDATFMSVAFQLPELGLLTLAMFIPILSGGLNLCIIATANLTSLLMAWVFLTWLPPDASMAMQAVWLTLALVGAMILALVIGMLTGALVAYVGAHPILVTLATMTMVNGVGIYLAGHRALYRRGNPARRAGSADYLPADCSLNRGVFRTHPPR